MTAPRYRWQPTTGEIAAAAGIPPSRVERFDQNTSPIAASWATETLARQAGSLNEYPAASYRGLRRAAAAFAGVPHDAVVPGAGADELILLAGRAFLRPGEHAVQVAPTYPLYEIATLQTGARLTALRATAPAFELPTATLVDAAADADLVWLCIPNNPTGARPADADLEAILAGARGVVVVDAAYAEFEGRDWSAWVGAHSNLLVLRTLSKAFGLAGARVGYALGAPDLISAVDAVRPPGSISSPSVAVATAALQHQDRMYATVDMISRHRDQLATGLVSLGIRVLLPSPTNFLLCEIGSAAPAVQSALLAQGMIARDYPEGTSLEHYLRFTVRGKEANDRLLTVLAHALK